MPQELERKSDYKPEIVAMQGLGFGRGPISVEAQLASGELTLEAHAKGAEIIVNDPEVFVPVDADARDDGCGDGRPAARIFQLIDSDTGEVKEYEKSRRRAKVFGGGLVVASSMWRAIRGAPADDETVLGDRRFMAAELQARGIEFGAHTDTHAHGDNCGCGAIDKYDEVSRNVGTYRPEITATLQALYGDTYSDNEAVIATTLDRYEQLAARSDYFADGSGQNTKDLLLEKGAVIKELDGNHLEDYIVLNDVEGTTFDQRLFDRKLEEAGVEGTAQAFVVDIWRGRMYAETVAEIAAAHTPGIDKEQAARQAYADFLVRTLATAATLTAGDLPVFGRRAEGRSHYALAA